MVTKAEKQALELQIKKAMGPVGYAIFKLMERPKVPAKAGKRKTTLHPEQLMSVRLADELRRLTLQWHESGHKHGLRAIWAHVANERTDGWFTQLLLRCMGMLPGAPDYWFIWEGGGCVIELKTPDNDLSEPQEYFHTWSKSFGVPVRVCRSPERAIQLLTEWGAIINPEHVAQDQPNQQRS